MKFFLDTASLVAIQEISRMGILVGIAIDAALVTDQGFNNYPAIHEICRYTDRPLSVGVLSIEEEAMVKEGTELAKIHSQILVKCPLTSAGLKATRRLTAQGIPVNVSLCFSLTQALIAAKAGARCVSVCLDRSVDGAASECDGTRQEVTRQIVTVFRNYGFSTQVLLAGIRSPHEVVESALAGRHICTMRISMFRQLFDPAS